jgi:hypothetical protein
MNPHSYKVTFCEADTGIVLNRDGSKWNRDSGVELFQPVFGSIDEARTLKDNLLDQTPNGEVVIECEGRASEIYRDDERMKGFMAEREALFKWRSVPPWLRIFKPKPTCKIYEDG